MLWSIVSWVFLILLILYLLIAIIVSVYYYNTQKSFEKFVWSSLQQLESNIQQTNPYDFKTDSMKLKQTNQLLARDVMRELMSYYNNNLNTVILVIQNTTSTSTHITFFESNLPIFPNIFSLEFQAHFITFIQHISGSIPSSVLQKTQFYNRFVTMLINTINDDVDSVAKLLEWIKSISI